MNSSGFPSEFCHLLLSSVMFSKYSPPEPWISQNVPFKKAGPNFSFLIRVLISFIIDPLLIVVFVVQFQPLFYFQEQSRFPNYQVLKLCHLLLDNEVCHLEIISPYLPDEQN